MPARSTAATTTSPRRSSAPRGQWHSGGYRFTRREPEPRSAIEHEVNPYVQEHIDLLESITSHKPVNELKQVAESTLTAIMGRMSAYTGKAVDLGVGAEFQARHLPQDPGHGDPMTEPPVPRPGVTELI